MKSIFRRAKVTKREVSEVMEHPTLSDGAKVLYSYLNCLRDGALVDSEDLVNDNVCTSVQMVNKYKRELKELLLIHENKDPTTNYKFLYLGSLQFNALILAEDWKNIPVDEVKCGGLCEY